jgi:hypothetical protein
MLFAGRTTMTKKSAIVEAENDLQLGVTILPTATVMEQLKRDSPVSGSDGKDLNISRRWQARREFAENRL